jgi:citrate synthase
MLDRLFPTRGIDPSRFSLFIHRGSRGGAIDTAYSVIQEVGTTDWVPELIKKVKEKECRLFGYGHRIYKGSDSRAKAIKEMLHALTHDVPVNDMPQYLSQ